MTIDELYNEFNLTYNNLASNLAPGLDKYEISVYLTKAQTALLDALYGEFENSEEVRRKLADVVVTAKLNPTTIATDNIIYPEYTTTFKWLDNVRYIIHESVKMNSKADRCVKAKFIRVQPCLHDEVDIYVSNPFKFNIRRALRLNTSDNGTPYIEILTKDKNIDYYQIRYIMNPKPIILDNLSTYYDSPTIEGESTPMTGSLASTLHRQIVEIAAKLAYADYKNK